MNASLKQTDPAKYAELRRRDNQRRRDKALGIVPEPVPCACGCNQMIIPVRGRKYVDSRHQWRHADQLRPKRPRKGRAIACEADIVLGSVIDRLPNSERHAQPKPKKPKDPNEKRGRKPGEQRGWEPRVKVTRESAAKTQALIERIVRAEYARVDYDRRIVLRELNPDINFDE